MPVMKHGTRQQGKAQTRKRILDAALELFASVGFEHTSIRMIGQRCGLRDGSLYYYFPSKEAILRCLMQERWELTPAFGRTPESSEPMSPERLDEIVDGMLDRLAEDNAMSRLIARQCLADDPEALHIRQVRREQWRQSLAEHFDSRFRPEDVDLLVENLMAVFTRISFMAQAESGDRLSERLRDPEFREYAHQIVRRAVPVERFVCGDVAR